MESLPYRPFVSITDGEYKNQLEDYIRAKKTREIGFKFYNKDHLGNNREVIDKDGVVWQRNDFYPYGTPFISLHRTINECNQSYKYNGKEFDMMHGLNTYDYGARQYSPILPMWDRVDPLAEKYYNVSPYAYCMNDPVNYVDPDGRSTWVINQGNGKYQVVGGNLNDKDKNIYVGSFDKKGRFVRGNSIGTTTSMTSFYNSDAKDGGHWSVGSIIDTGDRSGDKFLERIISDNPPMIDDYMMNARNNKPYDFKVTNGNDTPIKGIDIYRGMPIGENGKGQTIYTSARDIGNIVAGYVAGVRRYEVSFAGGIKFSKACLSSYPCTSAPSYPRKNLRTPAPTT